MQAIFDTMLSFPTVLWTAPMALCVVYWLIALVSGLGADLFDVEVDVEVDADAELGGVGGGAMHGLAEMLAFGTVPLTIILTLLVCFGFSVSFLMQFYLGAGMTTLLGGFLFGAALFLLSSVASLFLSAQTVKPLRPLFAYHTIHGQERLVGQMATLTSSRVTASFGTATLPAPDGSGPIHLNVIAQREIADAVGREVSIVDFDPETRVYTVVPMDEPQSLDYQPVSVEAAALDAALQSPQASKAAVERQS